MKVTIDKQYTTVANMPSVRAACKEFKSRYTDGDLKRVAYDDLGMDEFYNAEVVSATVEGFNATPYVIATQFWVTLIARTPTHFYTIEYTCDSELNVTDKSFTARTFAVVG